MDGKEKRRILFVDSDENVLQGLKRLLHSQRKCWNMTFVKSGQDALVMMEREAVDVIVSDLRLAEVDGITLLDAIKKRYPQVVRIVLSSESDRDWIMKSVRVSHQFLSKPCRPAVLKDTINRNCMILDLMRDTSVKRVVSRMETLPSLPSLYAEIMAAIQSPNASIAQIGRIITRDMAMTAKILHLVNSAFFGFPRHISNPAQAAVLLGLNTVKALVLSLQIFSQFEAKNLPAAFLEQLWQHNIRIGEQSKLIAEGERQEKITIDHAFMAGLLHDTGKLILAANFPEDYQRVLALFQAGGQCLYDSENEIFGVTHSEVGAYLMGLWGLPLPIVEALAFHHFPERSVAREFGPLTAVHIANSVSGRTKDDVGLRVDRDYLNALGLMDRLPVWEELLAPTNRNEEIHEAQDLVC